MSTKRDESPQHEHDCDRCVFLGRFEDADLYFHDGKENPLFTTVIARFGPDSEYTSGLSFSRPYVPFRSANTVPAMPSLAEARSRAIALGFGEAIEKAEGEQ
jgi:hypothetical protein